MIIKMVVPDWEKGTGLMRTLEQWTGDENIPRVGDEMEFVREESDRRVKRVQRIRWKSRNEVHVILAEIL